MSLRDEAIKAMRVEANAHGWFSEQGMLPAALDGLLDWLRDNAEQFAGPNLAPADQVRVIADLLSEEER